MDYRRNHSCQYCLWCYLGSYNNLVSLSEDVETKLSQIAIDLQRRNDLIPNLVETVKGFAAHEEEVIQSVTDARSKLAGASSLDETIEARCRAFQRTFEITGSS